MREDMQSHYTPYNHPHIPTNQQYQQEPQPNHGNYRHEPSNQQYQQEPQPNHGNYRHEPSNQQYQQEAQPNHGNYRHEPSNQQYQQEPQPNHGNYRHEPSNQQYQQENQPYYTGNHYHRGNQPGYPYEVERYPPSGNTPPFYTSRYHHQSNRPWRRASKTNDRRSCNKERNMNTGDKREDIHTQAEIVKLHCEPCKRDFSSADALKSHTKQHRECEEDGCNFVASAPVLKLHFVQVHQEGKFKIVLETAEDIAKWREERKRNWPTPDNIEAKKQKISKDKEDGIVVETKEFVYRERGEGRGRGRGRGRRNQGIMPNDRTRGSKYRHRDNERYKHGEKCASIENDDDAKNESVQRVCIRESNPTKENLSPERTIDENICANKNIDLRNEETSGNHIENDLNIQYTRINSSNEPDINEEKKAFDNVDLPREETCSANDEPCNEGNIIKSIKSCPSSYNSSTKEEDTESNNTVENISIKGEREGNNTLLTNTKHSNIHDCTEPIKMKGNTNCLLTKGSEVEGRVYHIPSSVDVIEEEEREEGELGSDDDVPESEDIQLSNVHINTDVCVLNCTKEISNVIKLNTCVGASSCGVDDGSGVVGGVGNVGGSNGVGGDDDDDGGGGDSGVGEGDTMENEDMLNKNPQHKKKPKRIKRQKKRQKKVPKKEMPRPEQNVSLLEMLLANEIRHERNVILQCIRYIVKHDFFDT